jgi:PKD repeat protein
MNVKSVSNSGNTRLASALCFRRILSLALCGCMLACASGWAADPQPGWQDLANTHLKDVAPPDNFGGMNYAFSYYARAVIAAWSGAVADTKRNRLIVWGGGHNDYYGNEIYALNLGSTPQTLTRLNDPSPIFDNSTPKAPAALADNKPNSRHTYNCLAYIEHADRMFVFNGALAGGSSGFALDTWTLDMNTLQWQRMDPTAGNPPTGYGPGWSIAAYDPNSKTVFVNWADCLWQYTYETNSYTLLSTNAHAPYSATGVIDPKRKLLIYMGMEYQSTIPKVSVIDISPGSDYQVQDWSAQVSGCDALAGVEYPGLAYDPVLDRVVGWPNDGNSVYIFDVDTKTATQQTFPNGPQTPAGTSTGTFGRFRYFPATNSYAVVNEWDQDAFVLTLGSTPPPPQPPAITSATTARGIANAAFSYTIAASNNPTSYGATGLPAGLTVDAGSGVISGVVNSAGTYSVTISATNAGGTGSATLTLTIASVTLPGTFEGLGASTATFLDVDGDGYGIGPDAIGPDADDTDPAVNTTSDVLKKYRTIPAFLTHLGYQANRIWYLSPNGDNTTGELDNAALPFRTFSAIQFQILPGDAVLFRGGTYTEEIVPPSGAAGQPVILMAYPGEVPTVDMSQASVSRWYDGLSLVNVSWVIVDGLRFINSQAWGGIAGGTYAPGGPGISLCHDNIIRHVEVLQSYWGIIMANGLENITIENCVIHDTVLEHNIYLGSREIPSKNVTVRRNLLFNSAVNGNGFQFNGIVTNLVLEQNVIHSNLLSGISLVEGVSSSFIRNNCVFNNQRQAIIIFNYDTTLVPASDQTNNLFENNTLYGSPFDRNGDAANGAVITVSNVSTGQLGNLGGNTFRNNIMIGSGNQGGAVTAGHYPPVVFPDANQTYLATSTFENNIFWTLDGASDPYVFGFGPNPSYGYQSYTLDQAQALTQLSGCLHTDPQLTDTDPAHFADPNAFNFRPQSGSVSLSAGLTKGAPPVDIVGNVRPAVPSIGAYEFASAPPPPPPPVIVSGPLATPNPANAGDTISFSATATAADGSALSYAWDFGDGSTGTGNTATHAYAGAGNFVATVTAASAGGTASASVTVNIVTPPPPPPPHKLMVSKLSGKILFKATGRDSASLSAAIGSPPAAIRLSGTPITVTIGGVGMTFQLNAKGQASSSNGTVSVKPAHGTLQIKGSFIGLSAATVWSAYGMTSSTVRNVAISMPVTVSLNGTNYSDTKSVRYTARAGTSGKFK